MSFKLIALAIIALLIIVLIPGFFPTTGVSAPLTDEDAVQIARNYVETNFEAVNVTDAQITAKNGGQWSITITYQQGTGLNCKVGKCYWQGPASMYCRTESNQSLGQCS